MPKRNPTSPPFESPDLEPVKFLQKGSWGFVWRYRKFSRSTGVVEHARTALGYVAVKCVEVSEYTRQTVQQVFGEARAQRQGAGNPNVVALHDVLVVDEDLVALVMEEIEGGRTLDDEIQDAHRTGHHLSALSIVTWATEIAQGLQAFHAPTSTKRDRIAHRDVAPDNVFLTPDKKVKLGDMGIATVVSESGLDSSPAAGRTIRMAPEQYHGAEFGTAVDYWALGLIVFELVTRTPLVHFCAERVPSMTPSPEYSRAIGEAVRRQARQHPSMHPDLRELIVELVVDDPHARGGIARVREAQRRIAASQDGAVRTAERPRPDNPPRSSRVGEGAPSWMSPEELASLADQLDSPPRGHSRDGAFERLVGPRRARRHRHDRRQP